MAVHSLIPALNTAVTVQANSLISCFHCRTFFFLTRFSAFCFILFSHLPLKCQMVLSKPTGQIMLPLLPLVCRADKQHCDLTWVLSYSPASTLYHPPYVVQHLGTVTQSSTAGYALFHVCLQPFLPSVLLSLLLFLP